MTFQEPPCLLLLLLLLLLIFLLFLLLALCGLEGDGDLRRQFGVAFRQFVQARNLDTHFQFGIGAADTGKPMAADK